MTTASKATTDSSPIVGGIELESTTLLHSNNIDSAVSPPLSHSPSPGGDVAIFSSALIEEAVVVEGLSEEGGKKKTVWDKPSPADVALEVVPLMGVAAWPALSESKKGSPKLPHSEGSSSVLPQMQEIGMSSSSQRQGKNTNTNPSSHTIHPAPTRQKSFRRGNGGSSGKPSNMATNGDFSIAPPSQGFGVDLSPNNTGRPASSESPSVENPSRESGGQRGGFGPQSNSGGETQHRNSYRKGTGGTRPNGEGSHYGGRPDQDRGNHYRNPQRNFGGRGAQMQPQRASTRPFIRGPPHANTSYVPPPPILMHPSFGTPMVYPGPEVFYYPGPYQDPFIGSSFLSTHSKLQILLEPFLWKKNEPSKQESVGNFFQRHFGKEVVDNLVDPFLAGTTGGDPESLSMRHTFPDLWNLEKRHGSIISGAFLSKVFSKKEGSAKSKGAAGDIKRPRGSFSFLGGMQTLTDALCKELGQDELKLHSRVLEFSSICNESSPLDSWSISYESPGKKQVQNKSYDAVIVTAPLNSVKDMKITKRGVRFLLDFIPEIKYISMSVITTAFKKERVERPLEGFGVLIPSKETQNGLKTLGTLFSSMMFPDRAPSDMYLYTTFVGGTRNQELTRSSWNELKKIVASDLQKLLGAEGEPAFVSQYNWNTAFPLYGHNYHLALEAIDKLEKNLPGFFYAGNHKGGLSVGKAISSGCCAADLVISYLNSCSDEKRNCH